MSLHIMRSIVCDKDYFGNKIKSDCRIAVSDQSYDQLKMQMVMI